MKFLDHPPHFLFFTGKGGVGKTSLAGATAIELADADKRVRAQYKAAVDALADPQRTRLILVARAQGATLREAARTVHSQNWPNARREAAIACA